MAPIRQTEADVKNNGRRRFYSRGWYKHPWFWLVLVVLIVAVFLVHRHQTSAHHSDSSSAGQGGKHGRQMGNPPVVTAKAQKSDVHVYLNALGAVTALNTVTVKSQVDGQLIKVLFQEGQLVKAGDLLAQIDPRPFQANLTQASGQLARDRALLENAELDLQRYQTLASEDSIAKQQLDTQNSLVHQYEGQVKIDQGIVDNAQLQLDYASIKAPIDGQIGLRQVDQGNIIHASDATGVAVLTQLQPITVIFSIPEDSLPQVLDKLKAGQKLEADAFNREETKQLATGALLAVDNQIDPTTGTVKLKAVFDNKDNALFPNQFVNIHLLVDTKQDATIVPTAALQQGPQGFFVFVLNGDQTVSVKTVKTGPSQDDNTSIEDGVSVGDTVVVEGADKLRDGIKVTVQGPGQDQGQSQDQSQNQTGQPSSDTGKKGQHKHRHPSSEDSSS